MKATFECDKTGGRQAARHNDRSFDISKADNIGDISKDTLTYFPEGDRPKRVPLQRFRLEQMEQEYYQARFGPAVDAQRERHIKARQKARAEGCTIERYYDNAKTCPTSIILQVGKEGEYQDRQTFIRALNGAIKDIEEGNEEARVKVLSIAVHGSETSLHAHMRISFEVKNKEGQWEANTEKCLEKLGYSLPFKDKKKDRYNNRKMTWTSQAREKWYDTIERVDPSIKIDREPSPDNPKTRGKLRKALVEMQQLKTLVRELQGELMDLQKGIDQLDKGDIEKRKKDLKKALERANKRFTKLSSYLGLNEDEKAPHEAPAESVDDIMDQDDLEI